jgi:hypothetical protein
LRRLRTRSSRRRRRIDSSEGTHRCKSVSILVSCERAAKFMVTP